MIILLAIIVMLFCVALGYAVLKRYTMAPVKERTRLILETDTGTPGTWCVRFSWTTTEELKSFVELFPEVMDFVSLKLTPINGARMELTPEEEAILATLPAWKGGKNGTTDV